MNYSKEVQPNSTRNYKSI